MRKLASPIAPPTPAEIAALFAAIYYLQFLANGNKGLLAGALLVGGAIVLSRLTGLIKPIGRSGPAAVWAVMLVVLVIALPFLSSGSLRTTQLSMVGYSAIATLALILLSGQAGQASVGHSAFIGIGAYMTAIAIHEWDANIVLAAALGTLCAGGAGFLVGIPALRLSGMYLAVATLGLAVVFVPVLKLAELADYTGGTRGISLFENAYGPPIDVDWLTPERWQYFITLSFLALTMFFMYNIFNSAAGRSLRAVRDNEIVASAMGVNIRAAKLYAFTISSAIAGFSGVLLFLVGNRFVSPDNFTLMVAIDFLVAMVLGGATTITGGVMGALFLIYVYREGLETIATQTTEKGDDTWLIIAGLAIALGLLFGNPWLNAQIRKYAPRLHSRFGIPLINYVRAGIAVALAFAGAAGIRYLGDHGLDLVAMRPAIAGAFLIIVVLFVPGGFVSLVGRIRGLTWTRIYTGIRDQFLPFPVPTSVSVPASGLPSIGHGAPLVSQPALAGGGLLGITSEAQLNAGPSCTSCIYYKDGMCSLHSPSFADNSICLQWKQA